MFVLPQFTLSESRYHMTPLESRLQFRPPETRFSLKPLSPFANMTTIITQLAIISARSLFQTHYAEIISIMKHLTKYSSEKQTPAVSCIESSYRSIKAETVQTEGNVHIILPISTGIFAFISEWCKYLSDKNHTTISDHNYTTISDHFHMTISDHFHMTASDIKDAPDSTSMYFCWPHQSCPYTGKTQR